jgi:hypothetical protein
MTLQTTELIIATVTLIFAYLISITLVAAGASYIAHIAGDDTPQEAGFGSMNPAEVFDVLGFFCTVIFGVGWGKMLPFNPHNVTRSHKSWWVFFVYMAQPLLCLLLALVALVTVVFISGSQSLSLVFWNLISRSVPLQQLAAMYPDKSSFILICVMFLLAVVALNIFYASLKFIYNIMLFVLYLGIEHGYNYMKYADVLAFFGPLILLFIYIGPLQLMLTTTLINLARLVAMWCGVCS